MIHSLLEFERSFPRGIVAARMMTALLCVIVTSGCEAVPSRAEVSQLPAAFWEDGEVIDVAVSRGLVLIERCANGQTDKLECELEPYKTCEATRGTSMRDMSDCAVVARRAWESLHASTIVKIGRRWPDPTKQDLSSPIRSEGDWRNWMIADCKARVLSYENGSIYRFVEQRCLSQGFARRTLDLIRYLEDLDR